MVGPSGYDVLTVPCKQEVTVPPDARCTARHLEVLARRSQHRGAPAVQTWESELLSSLACLQCRVMPCITGAAGAQQFRRPVQQEHWTCLGCLRACAPGPAPDGAPDGTFRSIAQDCDMISKIRARHALRRNELFHASAKPSSSDAVPSPFCAASISRRFNHPTLQHYKPCNKPCYKDKACNALQAS